MMTAVVRETKVMFWSRVEREGRRAEAEAAQAELLSSGLKRRPAQVALVERFQPLAGPAAVAWQTPDTWAIGRKDAKKPRPDSQERLELDCQWVHGHRDRPLEEAPTPGARLLLEIAQGRPGEFMKVYLKCLPSIVEREQARLKESRQKIQERRRAVQEQAKAQKRAAAEEETRKRAEARKQERIRRERESREQELPRCEQQRNARQPEDERLKPALATLVAEDDSELI